MGTLRLLLAISVVVVHSGPLFGLTFVGGVTAVQAFYVISGFYMAMILTEKYPATRRGTALFYGNRFLRIFPLYWIVLLATIAVFTFAMLRPGEHNNALALLVANWDKMPPAALAYLIASNVGLFGLDWAHFFTVPVAGTAADPSQFAIVPQAWTLGVELVVYLLAPLLFRLNTWIIAAVAVASLVARAVASNAGLSTDPWDYRFFPFELALFCSGALAFRIAPATFRSAKLVGYIGGCVLVALFLTYPAMPDGPSIVPGFKFGQLAFLLATILFIAPLFDLTKRWKNTDGAIGYLSYPVYLSHLIIVQSLAGHYGPGNTWPVVGAVALGWVFVRMTAPLENARQRRLTPAA